MKLSILVGATSQTINVFIVSSASASGAGLTGLVFNSPSLTAYYALPLAASVAITLATLAAVTSAWSSGGFKEIDATNMPGWYRLDVPDAAIASGRFVSLHLQGATNMMPTPVEIELTAWDNQNATSGGLSRIDAAISSRSTLAAGAQMDLVNAPNATALAAMADAFLKRDWSSVTGEASRSVLNALRKLRNKVSFASGTLTVNKEDDSTSAYTQTVAQDAAQTPFKSVG